MSLILLLTVLCVLPCTAETYFSEGFEEPASLQKWGHITREPTDSWAAIDRTFGAHGSAGVRITAGTGHSLVRNMRLPLSTSLFREGFYCSWDFRLAYADTAPANGMMAYLEMVGFLVLSASGEYFSDPTVIISRKADEKNYLKIIMRTRKGDNPVVLPAENTHPLESGRWYRARLFVQYQGHSLIDSLFLDDALLCAGSIALTDTIGILQEWHIGILDHSKTRVAFMDLDNITIGQSVGNTVAAPAVLRPIPYEYLYNKQPELTIAEDPAGVPMPIRISIDSGGKQLAESLFVLGSKLAFARAFAGNAAYSYTAVFKNTRSGVAPESSFGSFFIGAKDPVYPLPERKDFTVVMGTSSTGDNVFHPGDTIHLLFRFVPEKKDWYVDMNLCAASFDGSRNDRFGILDSLRNIVFSVDRDGEVYFKYPHGTNTWCDLQDTAGAGSYPLRVINSRSVSVRSAAGEIQASFTLNRAMRRGMWTVNAYFISDEQARMVTYPSLFFYILDPSLKRLVRVVLASALLICTIAIIFIIRRRRGQKSELPILWVNIANKVETFLREHAAESELNNQKIADIVRLSERRLSTIYQEVRGRSPIQHLREIRIEKACELLKTTEHTVSEIGYMAGFTDPVIFQRNFKTLMGMTPSQFREKAQT